MGVVVMGVLLALLVLASCAFLVLMAAVFVETASEVLDVDWMDVASAVLVLALAVFLAWFVAGMPMPGAEGYPQPILERRHDE